MCEFGRHKSDDLYASAVTAAKESGILRRDQAPRPRQQVVFSLFQSGKSVLYVDGTGAGKSLPHTLVALLLREDQRIVIFLSLNALAINARDRLAPVGAFLEKKHKRRSGSALLMLAGGATDTETNLPTALRDITMKQIRDAFIIIVVPEVWMQYKNVEPSARTELQTFCAHKGLGLVNYVVFDEVHLIMQWTFRPSLMGVLLELSSMKLDSRPVPVLFITATLSNPEKMVLDRALRGTALELVSGPIRRNDLAFDVVLYCGKAKYDFALIAGKIAALPRNALMLLMVAKFDLMQQLVEFLLLHRDTKDLFATNQVGSFHGMVDQDTKLYTLKNLAQLKVIVGSNAPGQGIDVHPAGGLHVAVVGVLGDNSLIVQAGGRCRGNGRVLWLVRERELAQHAARRRLQVSNEFDKKFGVIFKALSLDAANETISLRETLRKVGDGHDICLQAALNQNLISSDSNDSHQCRHQPRCTVAIVNARRRRALPQTQKYFDALIDARRELAPPSCLCESEWVPTSLLEQLASACASSSQWLLPPHCVQGYEGLQCVFDRACTTGISSTSSTTSSSAAARAGPSKPPSRRGATSMSQAIELSALAGNKCTCGDETKKSVLIECTVCYTWWHVACVYDRGASIPHRVRQEGATWECPDCALQGSQHGSSRSKRQRSQTRQQHNDDDDDDDGDDERRGRRRRRQPY